jgi:hypothetical protein
LEILVLSPGTDVEIIMENKSILEAAAFRLGITVFPIALSRNFKNIPEEIRRIQKEPGKLNQSASAN